MFIFHVANKELNQSQYPIFVEVTISNGVGGTSEKFPILIRTIYLFRVEENGVLLRMNLNDFEHSICELKRTIEAFHYEVYHGTSDEVEVFRGFMYDD